MNVSKHPLSTLAFCACVVGSAFVYNQAQATTETGAAVSPPQPRSSSIAITSDDSRLVVVNRGKNSVTILQVRNEQGHDVQHLIAEIPVGKEPRYVAISPDDRWAFVTNAVDGTVSVIDLTTSHPAVVGDPIHVGTEPRGIAFTPNGGYAFVANHTSGDVSVIDPHSARVINTVHTGGNPIAVAITNNGDENDRDEKVYVTRFFGELINAKNRPDGFDDSKQGIVDAFKVDEALHGKTSVHQVALPPLADTGFKADRRPYCLKTRKILQDNGKVVFFNSGADGTGDGAAALSNEIFCPDPQSEDASDEGAIANTSQGAYPNQLYSAMIRGDRLYVPNVGAGPAPPLKFNVNVQALVGVVDTTTNGYGQHIHTQNLNAQIAKETQPQNEFESLDRLFLNDMVAVDADRSGQQFFFVSRGGNYVLRASLDKDGKIDIGAPNHVVRYQTGNMPTGVVVNSDTSRLYTINEINFSVTAVDLNSNQVLALDIPSSEPPLAGSEEHRVLTGKLGFFTALGIPDTLDTNGDGQFDFEIRDIVPLKFRNKASDNAWSGCGSCHEDGHTDNVSWSFPTGSRQTIELASSFAKDNIADQRIFNWNAVRGSMTDFNQNSQGVQGGKGFATDVNGVDRTGEIFNHGPTEKISDALDAQTEWVAKAVRAPIMPDANRRHARLGKFVFGKFCVSCHGGAKWTKSQAGEPVYIDNPALVENPIGENFFNGVPPVDPRVTVAGPQIVSVTDDHAGTLTFVENVNTFNADSPTNIRGAGAIAGQNTQGFPELNVKGAYNVPSLLGVGYHAPYLHDGSAAKLEDVFAVHTIPKFFNQPIARLLNAQIRRSLAEFLNSIDDDTKPFENSDTDKFLRKLGKK